MVPITKCGCNVGVQDTDGIEHFHYLQKYHQIRYLSQSKTIVVEIVLADEGGRLLLVRMFLPAHNY